ncbi:MAG: GNAT family N-acetyltransferase [Clostridiales bacterium]|nr:GNAT family N-acetyltransferase [Clostridiales bacterium]
MGIEIRQMAAGDIGQIADMFDRLYGHLNSKGFVLKLNLQNIKPIIEASLSSNFSRIYVAHVNNKVVGFININISKINIKFKSETSKYIGNITELFVDSDFRGNNLGKLLVMRAKKFFSENGVEYVQVNTMVGNTRAVEFYKNNGFSEDYISFIEKI